MCPNCENNYKILQAMETKLLEAEQKIKELEEDEKASEQLHYQKTEMLYECGDKIAELETRAQQAERLKCPDLTVHHFTDFNKTKE